jgi:hypothetical protein
MNINGLNSPVKNMEGWVGLKSKGQPFASYKEHKPVTKTNICLSWKGVHDHWKIGHWGKKSTKKPQN